MGTYKPRAGSLQIWPRKRAERFLPSVNWTALEKRNKHLGLLGFIGYKVGMSSALVKDLTANSMTKDKKIVIPVSILEVPPLKIFSVRLYKNNLCIGEIVISNDKELKRVLKIGKQRKTSEIEKLDKIEGCDDLRLVVYALVSRTRIKKTPDVAEIAIGGALEDKIKFIKQHWSKEILSSEIFKEMQLVDIRGLSKGHGTEGPVKRFGISLKSHKSEKGRRRPGSLGPWHPHHVTFRVAQAGQLGMQTRIIYNNKIIRIGKISENDINPKSGWHKYGKIRTEYIILRGSVPGASKRQLLLTCSLRKTKSSEKRNYEFLKLE